jgi:hypothetical protein
MSQRIVSPYVAPVVPPVVVLWINSSHVRRRAAVRFTNTQILLTFHRARYRFFSILRELSLFLRQQPKLYRLVQYSDLAGQVVRVWLGQDGGPSRQLPGWSPSSYIGLEADIEKRDAVVAAFRVRLSPNLLAPWLTRVSSTRG